MPGISNPLLGLGALRQWMNRRIALTPDWLVYALGAVPVLWLYWRGFAGTLGIDPVQEIEHRLGLWALWLLLAGLAITPLRERLRVNLTPLRRALGLLAFGYLLLHLLTWAILDVQSLDRVWADILKRPYITIGMIAFALLTPLALTSWNGAIRRMGIAAWRQLHKLLFPAVLLGGLHFVMLRKGWQLEPLFYLGAAVLLILARWPEAPANSRK